MSHTVSVGQFSGPLDLLLEQAKRGNVEISAISIADITHSYITELAQIEEELEPSEVSEFAELGARLLYIKSLALLPVPALEEQAGELGRLEDELAHFQLVKQLAAALSQTTGCTTARPPQPLPHKPKLPAVPVSHTPTQLAAAYAAVLARQAPKPRLRQTPAISLKLIAAQLLERLQQRSSSLQDLLAANANSKSDTIVTFMAVLELVKQHQLTAKQTQSFGAILLEVAHG